MLLSNIVAALVVRELSLQLLIAPKTLRLKLALGDRSENFTVRFAVVRAIVEGTLLCQGFDIGEAPAKAALVLTLAASKHSKLTHTGCIDEQCARLG